MKKFYIYQTVEGIRVIPSRRSTEKEVWDFAIKWLRPATVGNDAEAEIIVRENGEVIRDDE
jgi:hypothetical protein